MIMVKMPSPRASGGAGGDATNFHFVPGRTVYDYVYEALARGYASWLAGYAASEMSFKLYGSEVPPHTVPSDDSVIIAQLR